LNGYKRRARERLTSEEGLKHRGQKCIELEAVFGQMKYNMQYKRLRHFHKDKVNMGFAFFAIAFNIKKLCAISQRNGIKLKWGVKTTTNSTYLLIWRMERRLYEGNESSLAA